MARKINWSNQFTLSLSSVKYFNTISKNGEHVITCSACFELLNRNRDEYSFTMQLFDDCLDELSLKDGHNVDRAINVKASATCSKDDVFSEEKGKKIAFERAREAAISRALKLINRAKDLLDRASTELNVSIDRYTQALDSEAGSIERIINE